LFIHEQEEEMFKKHRKGEADTRKEAYAGNTHHTGAAVQVTPHLAENLVVTKLEADRKTVRQKVLPE
jgi:hypothetical protein